jgi:hypothetical protein
MSNLQKLQSIYSCINRSQSYFPHPNRIELAIYLEQLMLKNHNHKLFNTEKTIYFNK